MAGKKGDLTGKMLGRMTLNPIAHIDPLGTIVFPLLCLLFGGSLFGWAKPVPVNASNLKSPRRDMALVALAGPLSNLFLACLFLLLLALGAVSGLLTNEKAGFWPIGAMLARGILLNLFLGFFNLLPISPLDGARVSVGLLPPPLSNVAQAIAPYGAPFLIMLWISGLTGFLVYPVLGFLNGLLSLVGILFSMNLHSVFHALMSV